MTEGECRHIARDVECVVVSVEYHLAPEHKFPIPVEDCYKATTWVVDHAVELAVDPERVAVGGGSAGGNLAAAVALMARDRGGPKLLLQVLDVPVTDSRMKTPSMDENAQGYLLTKEAMQQAWDLYLRGPDDARNPYASPAVTEDLSGLPPALVLTAEYDPLRDEGEEYGRRLQAAGVPATVSRYDGMIHGFTFLTKILSAAREGRAEVIAASAGRSHPERDAGGATAELAALPERFFNPPGSSRETRHATSRFAPQPASLQSTPISWVRAVGSLRARASSWGIATPPLTAIDGLWHGRFGIRHRIASPAGARLVR